MKKHFYETLVRFVCVIVLFASCCAAISSCAGGGTDTVTTTEPETETESVTTVETPEPRLPDVKYGCDFTVANGFFHEGKYTTNAIKSDGITGEPINDALYKRTVLLKQNFDVDIVDLDVGVSTAMINIKSGDPAYDIVTVNLSDVMKMVNAGLTYDFNDISSIDLEKPWWDQNAIKNLSVGGKVYYTFSDFLITAIDNSRATYFNKQIYRDLAFEDDIYALVKDGKWTLDKFVGMCQAAVQNLDGNEAINVRDRLGVFCHPTFFFEAMLVGADAEVIRQGSDGYPTYFCFDEREKFTEIYTKLFDCFINKDYALAIDDVAGFRPVFISGHSLFEIDTMQMASILRKYDIDFGILPIAKYDENQKDYWSTSPNPHAILVPNVIKDVERTGVILEALAYYSCSYFGDEALIPAYYEISLKGRSTTDSESAENLVIIHDHISYCNKVEGAEVRNIVYNLGYKNKQREISSLLQRIKSPALKKLKMVLDKLQEKK